MATDGGFLPLAQLKAKLAIEYKCPIKAMYPNLHRQHLEKVWSRMACRLINGYRPPDENRMRKAREIRERQAREAGIGTWRLCVDWQQRAEGAWVRMTCRLIDPSADSTWVPWDTRSFEYRRKWLPSCLLPRSRKAIELTFSRHRQITRNPDLQMGRYTLYRHVALNTDSIDTAEVGTQTES